jgi:crotonobetainyl-CoA:carnitine CoA-transferase CaiB-like acyl-CoA transferase
MEKALGDLRVLELSQGWAGSLCGRLLADLGAEVIKVEPPSGDELRGVPPFKEGKDGKVGYLFQMISAGKRSVVLDLTQRGDRELLIGLAQNADVLVEDFPVGKMDELAIGYGALKEGNPRLIYCSITPFGQTGPLSKKAACDIVVQAMSGMMATTGFPGDTPTKAGSDFAEYNGAIYATIAILAALAFRDRSQIGQAIDMSIHDCMVLVQNSNLPSLFVSGKVESKLGNANPLVAPLNSYETKDGWIIAGAVTDKQWNTLSKLMGKEHLIEDSRFDSTAKRAANREEIDVVVTEWTGTKTVLETVKELEDNSLPAGPILTMDQLLRDEHFLGRNMVVEVEDPVAGKMPTFGSVFKMSETPGGVERGAPVLGQDTEEILTTISGCAEEGIPESEAEKPSFRKVDKVDKALGGIRVLEVGIYTAGPFCARLLANLGCEVIKVEPVEGELIRRVPPLIRNESCAFHLNNNCKKGIALDIRKDKGKEIIKKLVKQVDVLVENFSFGTMERLDLGYNVLREVNPALIYCSLTGFGQTGPYREKLALDTIIQAMSGLMDLTGWPDGPPVKYGLSASDQSGASFAALAILAALHYRHRTGKGQYIDLSMQDLSSWFTQAAWPAYFESGHALTRCGNHHPQRAPHNTYETSDGYAVIAVRSESDWKELLKVMDSEDLMNHPKYDSMAKRIALVDEIDALVSNWTETKTTEDIVDACTKAGVPSAEILELDQVVNHPQTLHREIVVDVEHPSLGKIRTTGSPFKMSETPVIVDKPAPGLGQHNEEVLCGLLGYGKEEVRRLRDEKVI